MDLQNLKSSLKSKSEGNLMVITMDFKAYDTRLKPKRRQLLTFRDWYVAIPQGWMESHPLALFVLKEIRMLAN